MKVKQGGGVVIEKGRSWFLPWFAGYHMGEGAEKFT